VRVGVAYRSCFFSDGVCCYHGAPRFWLLACLWAFGGPSSQKRSEKYPPRQDRSQGSRLIVLDEFSMIGRQMLGKIAFKTGEFWGGEEVMGGSDVILPGDVRQAQPIGGEPMHKTGGHMGKELNKPCRGAAPPNTLDNIENLTGRADP